MQEKKEVIGYFADGEFYCFNCGEDVEGEKTEIYGGDVLDYIPFCSGCGEPIWVEPTDDALEKLASLLGVRRGDEYWISEKKLGVLKNFLRDHQYVGMEWVRNAIEGGFLKVPEGFDIERFFREIFSMP